MCDHKSFYESERFGGAMRDLNFQHLKYFWAVAREGNLTRAAEKLRVTQSAVSVQIKKLEDAMGHPLFEREGRGLRLTQAGRVTLDYADSIFSIGDELLGVLDGAADNAQKTLRVGVLATLSRNFQMGFLHPLLNREDVILALHAGTMDNLLERLEAHQLDIVLTNVIPTRHAGNSWVAHRLGEQSVSLIGQPRLGRPRKLRQLLAQEPLVVPTAQSGIRTGFDALVEGLGVKPRIVAEVDDMAMLRLVARAHRGLSVIPPIVVRDELASGTLTEVQRLPDLVEHFVALTVSRRLPNRLLRELLGRKDVLAGD
jgi:LysR family transcriptional activator of nhaA